MAKDLEYYLAQARRIAEHREAGVEKEIRKLYKAMLKDLQQFMSQTYVQYAEDDKLTFAMLQKAGYDARFLEEIEQRLNLSTPKAAAELRKLVEETYTAAYEGMAQGVLKASSGSLSAVFEGAIAITPEQIKAAVENPVSGLTLSDTLEKNRKEIIYNIKQVVGVGLMNGDRYTTMAKRIAEHVDGNYRKAIRIARTEAHRVREAGHIDAAVKVDAEMQKGTTGMRMVKVWRSMKDERVRPQRSWKTKKGWKRSMGSGPENHIKLDGQTVLASEPFDMGHSGLKAMAPGQSGNAGDDINCRCYASYEMMTDAAYYAKTGKHFVAESVEPMQRYSELFEPDEDWSHLEETRAWDAIRSQNVSDDEFKQITDGYIGTPASWEINEAFREYPGLSTKEAFTKFFEGVPYEDVEQSIKVADALDSVIKKNVIPKNSELTRYVSADYTEEVFGLSADVLAEVIANFDDDGVKNTLKKITGTKVVERGFMSASATGDSSYTSLSRRNVVLKLQVDEGTNAYITDNIVEAEVILGRDTEYQIIGFQKGMRNRLEVIAKVLKK